MNSEIQNERYLSAGVDRYETNLELHNKHRGDGYGGEPTLVPLNQAELGGSGFSDVTPAGKKALAEAFRREYRVEEADHSLRVVHERLAVEPGWEYDPDDWRSRYLKLPVGKALFEPYHVAVYSIEYTDQQIEPRYGSETAATLLKRAIDRAYSDERYR